MKHLLAFLFIALVIAVQAQDPKDSFAYYKRYLASDDTIKLAREYAKQRLDVLE